MNEMKTQNGSTRYPRIAPRHNPTLSIPPNHGASPFCHGPRNHIIPAVNVIFVINTHKFISRLSSRPVLLPAILLPFFLVLIFFLPPFRLRPLFFLAVLALLEWRSLVSPWPPNAGDARPMRYGVASSWIFVLPVLERIVLHVPERDFWRVDPADKYSRERGERPHEWSLEKRWWAVRLVCTPRAVGWDFGGRTINKTREGIKQARVRGDLGRNWRAKYVAGCLGRAFLCYLVWDVVMLAVQQAVIPDGWAWEWLVLGRIAYAGVLMILIVYCGMVMQFNIAAGIGVGLFLNGPEEWPPLFGSVMDCYTTANVWGKFWHQYIRQPSLGLSHRLLAALHIIPRRSRLAYLVHLLIAFATSDFCHVLAVGTMAPGYCSLTAVIADMSLFFLLQPVAATVEGVIISLFTRYVWAPLPDEAGPKKDGQGQEQQGQQGKSSAEATHPGDVSPLAKSSLQARMVTRKRFVNGLIMALCHVVGYTWVFCWFFVTGWWFVRAYLNVRMQD